MRKKFTSTEKTREKRRAKRSNYEKTEKEEKVKTGGFTSWYPFDGKFYGPRSLL